MTSIYKVLAIFFMLLSCFLAYNLHVMSCKMDAMRYMTPDEEWAKDTVEKLDEMS